MAIGIWSLDRIWTKIIGFRIQILPKCHQKVQLEHYFSQRVFRVRTKQNILELSTLRAFFKSEEIKARGSVPTALNVLIKTEAFGKFHPRPREPP